jgi:hypothetical protein
MNTSNSRTPTHDAIAACAYLIWKREGCPEGREKEHWLQAEIQLDACAAHDLWSHSGDGQHVSFDEP